MSVPAQMPMLNISQQMASQMTLIMMLYMEDALCSQLRPKGEEIC